MVVPERQNAARAKTNLGPAANEFRRGFRDERSSKVFVASPYGGIDSLLTEIYQRRSLTEADPDVTQMSFNCRKRVAAIL